MKLYIISHMMTSVDGRIDCPMVGQRCQRGIFPKAHVQTWKNGLNK